MKTSMLFDTPLEKVERGLNAYIHVEDEHGRRIVSKKAQTLLTAFYKILYAHMSAGSVDIVDIDSFDRNIRSSLDSYNVKAASGDTTLGIVVGTSTTPVAITDFRLGSLIGHGVGAGNLLYGSVDVTPLEISGEIARFFVTRLLTNNSGADVTVNEIGLIGVGRGFRFLLDRTLATFIVPNGSSRNVIYEFRVVV